MNKLKLFSITAIAILGVAIVGQAVNFARAATTLTGNNEVITINGTTDGLPVNSPTYFADSSADGNIIVFSSSATNLPNPGGSGLYVYNIRMGNVGRVDVSTNGVAANKTVNNVKVSETGRYITFTSNATNLLDTVSSNNYYATYVRDVSNSTTQLISAGLSSDNYYNSNRNLGVSNDRRFTLFASRYTNGTYPYLYKILISDNTSQTSTTLGISTGGNEGSSSSNGVRGSMSCDGSFAIFEAQAVYFADIRNQSNPQIIQLASSGVSPQISCNGRYMLYTTADQNITPKPSNVVTGKRHLVRYDRVTGEKKYIDSNSIGTFAVGFESYSGMEPEENIYNATVADTGDVVFKYNNYTYLKHLSDGSGTLESIGKKQDGTSVNIPYGKITRDGRYIFFQEDPASIGISSTTTGTQIIRSKTNL